MNDDSPQPRERSRSRDNDPDTPEARRRPLLVLFQFQIAISITVPKATTFTETLMRAIARILDSITARAARLTRLNQNLRANRGSNDLLATVILNVDD